MELVKVRLANCRPKVILYLWAHSLKKEKDYQNSNRNHNYSRTCLILWGFKKRRKKKKIPRQWDRLSYPSLMLLRRGSWTIYGKLPGHWWGCRPSLSQAPKSVLTEIFQAAAGDFLSLPSLPLVSLCCNWILTLNPSKPRLLLKTTETPTLMTVWGRSMERCSNFRVAAHPNATFCLDFLQMFSLCCLLQ